LKSAYHQIPLQEEDKPYSAFEASAGLYQFTHLPFGVTNGVACFQRIMTQFVQKEKLHAVFPYLDNIMICDHSKENHDENLKRFFKVAQCRNLVLNESKNILTTRKLPILGYEMEESEIRPDPERLQPLR